MSCRNLSAVLLALVLLATTAQLAACGGIPKDPFVGSWWEPASGRRVQVEAADGGGHEVHFGSDLTAYPAEQSGDELLVTHPELGAVRLKTAPEGRLRLVGDGTESLLERVPQHQ